MNRDNISIAGGWLGTYRYGGVYALLGRPVRFEASFKAEASGGFTGEILDDRYPGRASAAGEQAVRQVRFTKTYISVPVLERTRIAEYHGILSDDGQSLRGTWQITVQHGLLDGLTFGGKWEARRMWNEAEQPYAASDAQDAEIELRAPAGAAR